ncbi:hypothetical protein hrd7_24620 [Leptolinea sp. HRD-7]|nr:hypothetical protein hrd7_24620 [Leptolinea sp. HRD-7]
MNFLIVLLVVVSAVPCLVGFKSENSELVYTGVVFNPIDGYSYLAKMEIGHSGDWLFTLPFSRYPGEGRLLFPFYVTAGQISRLFSVPASFFFNFLRVLAYGFLLWIISRLIISVKKFVGTHQSTLFLMIGFGGGLGWMLLPFGKFGADFWVAEAFPFLSGLANPHFPLAIGLAVGSLLLLSNDMNLVNTILAGLGGLLLSILSPFGFVVIASVITLSWIWERIEKCNTSAIRIIVFILFGLPYSIYQYWAVQSTSQLTSWTAQNQTPSPAVWDIFLTFSPWIILVIFGAKFIFDMRNNWIIRKLIVWMVVGLVLTVIPFNLQRRFLFGLFIPITVLGFIALPIVAEKIRISFKKLLKICLIMTILTPLFLLSMTIFAPLNHNSLYYYRSDELEAIDWLSTQERKPVAVLASSETGLLIPTVRRIRVLYGHPFESIDADNNKKAVENFFDGRMEINECREFLEKNEIDWVFIGPRERLLGESKLINDIKPDKQFGQVSLYSVSRLLKHD